MGAFTARNLGYLVDREDYRMPRTDETPTAYDRLLKALEAHLPSDPYFHPHESPLEAAFTYRMLSDLLHAASVHPSEGDERQLGSQEAALQRQLLVTLARLQYELEAMRREQKRPRWLLRRRDEARLQELETLAAGARGRQAVMAAVARAALEELRDESVHDWAERVEHAVAESKEPLPHPLPGELPSQPGDPDQILTALPDEYREWFLSDYRAALRSAWEEPEGYRALRWTLRTWATRAALYSDPAYQGEVAAIRRGEGQGRPGREVIAEIRSRRGAA
jgi:Family of unknown function (DUF6247)